MDNKVLWLIDRTQIQDTFTRYASSVDRCDWPRLRSVFTDVIERDLSSFTGSPPEKIKSEQHVNECRSTLPGFDSTQHFLLNSDIVIDGHQAEAVVYMIADHTLVEDGQQKQFTIRGYYTYRFTRSNTDWKICAMKLNILSTRGDQNIFEIAGKRAAALDAVQRDALR